MVLARIAAKHGHEDLAELFRAPVMAWRLVGLIKDEQQQRDESQQRKDTLA